MSKSLVYSIRGHIGQRSSPSRKRIVKPDYVAPEYNRAALLTIDLQRDFLDGHRYQIVGTAAALPAVTRLVKYFRQTRQPIVHAVRLYKSDGSNVDLCRRGAVQSGESIATAGSEGSQLAEPLSPSPETALDTDVLLSGRFQAVGSNEWIMYKPRWSAFYQTALQSHLEGLGVSTVVFTGCNFPNCPRASIYEASERDFRIVAIEDAISGFYAQGRAELEAIGVRVLDTPTYLTLAGSQVVGRE